MDATCTIQDSIHVFRLVHKYVSRILGTYQCAAACFIGIIDGILRFSGYRKSAPTPTPIASLPGTASPPQLRPQSPARLGSPARTLTIEFTGFSRGYIIKDMKPPG